MKSPKPSRVLAGRAMLAGSAALLAFGCNPAELTDRNIDPVIDECSYNYAASQPEQAESMRPRRRYVPGSFPLGPLDATHAKGELRQCLQPRPEAESFPLAGQAGDWPSELECKLLYECSGFVDAGISGSAEKANDMLRTMYGCLKRSFEGPPLGNPPTDVISMVHTYLRERAAFQAAVERDPEVNPSLQRQFDVYEFCMMRGGPTNLEQEFGETVEYSSSFSPASAFLANSKTPYYTPPQKYAKPGQRFVANQQQQQQAATRRQYMPDRPMQAYERPVNEALIAAIPAGDKPIEEIQTGNPEQRRRVLTLPPNHTLGRIQMRSVDAEPDQPWIDMADARGTIRIPEGTRIGLLVDPDAADANLLSYFNPRDLTSIEFKGPRVTDQTLKQIRYLTGLERVKLENTANTDLALLILRELPFLQTLWLAGVPISDRGLVDLHPMKDLQSILIERTHVSERGIRKLREALPNCQIEHDEVRPEIR